MTLADLIAKGYTPNGAGYGICAAIVFVLLTFLFVVSRTRR